MSDSLTNGTSKTLLCAAMAGLFASSVIVACASDDEEPGERPSTGGAGGADSGSATGGTKAEGGAPAVEEEYNVVLDENATEEDLVSLCDEREGWLYRTASCAGSGLCKGLFLLGGTLTDHSCKGMNGCGGLGCISLPEDKGRTGKEVYEGGGCENCHGKWSDDYSSVDMTYYRLLYPTTMTEEQKIAQFEGSSLERLTSIMVFGTQGTYENGEQFSNMPAYFEKYSRDEIQRAIEHIRGLTILPTPYSVPGGLGGASGGM